MCMCWWAFTLTWFYFFVCVMNTKWQSHPLTLRTLYMYSKCIYRFRFYIVRCKSVNTNALSTFPGEIQVHIFEGHHYHIWGLENDALHNILSPGAYARLWTLSVGCIQHQVTLRKNVVLNLIRKGSLKYSKSLNYLKRTWKDMKVMRSDLLSYGGLAFFLLMVYDYKSIIC